jgi:hypothetical protein
MIFKRSIKVKEENPFKFGSPVRGAHYFPRPLLEERVKEYLRNKVPTLILGAPHSGKSSFLRAMQESFEAEGAVVLLIDLYTITSYQDFLHQCFRALRSKERVVSKLKGWMKKITRIRPQLNFAIAPTGTISPNIGLNLGQLSQEDSKLAIEELFGELPFLGKEVIILLDDAHKIASLNDGGWLEATLSTYLQQESTLSFLCTGSRHLLTSKMLHSPLCPLYSSFQLMQLSPFGTEFTHYLIERFASAHISCPEEVILRVREVAQESPHYIQMILFHLAALGKKEIDLQDVERVATDLISQNHYAYQTRFAALTAEEQLCLRTVAASPCVTKEEGVLLKLKERLFFDIDEGRVLFDDPLFARWL